MHNTRRRCTLLRTHTSSLSSLPHCSALAYMQQHEYIYKWINIVYRPTVEQNLLVRHRWIARLRQESSSISQWIHQWIRIALVGLTELCFNVISAVIEVLLSILCYKDNSGGWVTSYVCHPTVFQDFFLLCSSTQKCSSKSICAVLLSKNVLLANGQYICKTVWIFGF